MWWAAQLGILMILNLCILNLNSKLWIRNSWIYVVSSSMYFDMISNLCIAHRKLFRGFHSRSVRSWPWILIPNYGLGIRESMWWAAHLGTYFDDLKSVHCPQKVISRLSFKVSKVLALNSLFAKVARGKNAFLHVRFREIFFANCHARAHAHWVQKVCTAK